jgi:hypothetical protein
MVKYQQGDVIIRKLNEPIKETNKDYNDIEQSCLDKNERWNQENRTVIAEGEATGHAHAFNQTNNPDINITLFKEINEYGNIMSSRGTPGVMRIEGGDALLTHEEHNPISIPPGEYQITQVREFDYLRKEIRTVVD